jgi:pSer/pThr/pTyr-binding forkhead associated (FHA) protein
VYGDGAVIEIDGTIVVGRDPSSSLVANSAAVPIADDGRTMSKSHAVLSVTDEGLFVEDLHSTNGVRIIRDGKEIVVSAGSPARVRADDVLVLGEREFVIAASA